MLEETYTCWHQDQTEDRGKKLKAPNVEAAAKMAVDIWRHEGIFKFPDKKFKVLVKDRKELIHEVMIPLYS